MGIMESQRNLDFDEKVTKYWPEFGAHGKGHLKVEDIMRHETGLPVLSRKVDLDWCLTENIKKN